jgi:hypothetical protein
VFHHVLTANSPLADVAPWILFPQLLLFFFSAQPAPQMHQILLPTSSYLKMEIVIMTLMATMVVSQLIARCSIVTLFPDALAPPGNAVPIN